jgi:hypothetical protein
MREGIVTKPAWIGKSVARKEDRSPYPHARIVRIDVTGARRLPGEAIFTPADVVARTEPLTALRPLPDVPRLGYYAMADGVALYEGQPVVSVVAVDRHVAEDALDLLDIEYEPLPRVSDAETALEPGAPRLHAHLPSNLLIRNPRTAGDPEAAFARADIGDRFRINRVTGLPIEGRAILAYGPGGSAPHLGSRCAGGRLRRGWRVRPEARRLPRRHPGRLVPHVLRSQEVPNSRRCVATDFLVEIDAIAVID